MSKEVGRDGTILLIEHVYVHTEVDGIYRTVVDVWGNKEQDSISSGEYERILEEQRIAKLN